MSWKLNIRVAHEGSQKGKQMPQGTNILYVSFFSSSFFSVELLFKPLFAS